jgi:hypothetical protein
MPARCRRRRPEGGSEQLRASGNAIFAPLNHTNRPESRALEISTPTRFVVCDRPLDFEPVSLQWENRFTEASRINPSGLSSFSQDFRAIVASRATSRDTGQSLVSVAADSWDRLSGDFLALGVAF